MNTNDLRGIADALEIDCIAKCADEIDRLREGWRAANELALSRALELIRLTNEAVAADIRISNDAHTIATLQTALAQPKGLFIDMIAQHPGLSDELKAIDHNPDWSAA